MPLMKLRNNCIDNNFRSTPSTLQHDKRSIQRMAAAHGGVENTSAVQLDGRGIPAEILGKGHHFQDLPRQRRPEICVNDTITPTEEMRWQVAVKGLKRPEVNKYSGKQKRGMEK